MSTIHILCVLKLTCKTELVPPYYILSRWRKDIKKRYTLIKCGFDPSTINVELQRVNKVCNSFYDVVASRVNSEDDVLKLMNWINDLKKDFIDKEAISVTIEEDTSIQNQVSKTLDPSITRSKWRPPSKRKSSKVD